MSDTFHRARLSILNQILSFPTIRGKDWSENDKPDVGSLVVLSCAPVNKWYLSWVTSVELGESVFAHRYGLKSIEDGEESWWYNCMLFRYNPEIVDKYPEWRWSDKQFSFWGRWERVCYKQNNAYIIVPRRPEFDKNGGVTLSLRERWGGVGNGPNFTYEENFPQWNKLTMKTMSEFYLKGCEVRNERIGERK